MWLSLNDEAAILSLNFINDCTKTVVNSTTKTVWLH
ncbi:hypothetical protein ISN45_Aa01g040750 [Arabidopsis thaliana x Arabidopsis arenosa]|uniref:Uncharacterized protein n=2 Tax=Arabidopsis TaxID=3701 RepID=A0A8T2CMP5_ARASU|nr:hypothetical protein ISN45_Aa01g040750 [Arabidopsis thaliana x Arabidopsis arenosa]KAG7600737.1 hypothetical protein ISN44_As06g048090 [Arabidopsis suecica]